MLARQSGRILNVGSTAGFQPGPYMATYYATKAFVNSFSEALSYELRGRQRARVTLSCPGPTETEFGDISGVQQDAASSSWARHRQPAWRNRRIAPCCAAGPWSCTGC